jgi:ferrous iron transport protein B
MAELAIAIAAIPNTGKTTLFNRLTGANQTVGNWAGVTVEKKVGRFRLDEYEVELTDLPGAYSITPSSIEERVVRDYLLGTPPDLLLNVVDVGNLYRGLGLTLQLAMTGIPMVLAVNMMDEARRKGLEVDVEALSEHLGIPAVPVVARTGEGISQLEQAMVDTVKGRRSPRPPHLSCPPVLEQAIADLARDIEARARPDKHTKPGRGNGLGGQFVAMRLLEGGGSARRVIKSRPLLADLTANAGRARAHVEQALDERLPVTCARCRFNAARGLVQEVTHRPAGEPPSATRRIDDFVLHPWLGLPLFLLVMLLMFQGVYTLGAPLQDWLGTGVAAVQEVLRGGAEALGWAPLLIDFLIDGLVEGVGVVASFFPIIVLFFVFLSLIEDSGYMARAAFLMDRVMHVLRLDGKAFVSIVLGFGCNVPAVMGTRILSSRHNRVLTMLLVPFSLCSARLQVFLFLAGILFAPTVAGWVIFGLYFASFFAIVLIGLMLRPFRIGGRPEPFIMELPPYRLPVPRVVALRAWQEVREFLYRAATLIVLGVVAVWFLTHFPLGVPISETLAGRLGGALEPIFDPLGIHWRETVALIFGVIAKEIVVGAMAVIYSAGPDLAARLAADITPLQGLSFMVFTLLYTPCIATVAAIRAESASWKVTLLSLSLSIGSAWVASFLVYQGGRLLGFV